MRYYLWLNEKQDGPYHSDGIRRMLYEKKISELTLATPEHGNGEWIPINRIEEITSFPSPTPKPANKINESPISLPLVQSSTIAGILMVIASVDILGSLLGGFAIGSGSNGNVIDGVCFGVGGVLGGLLLLGFACVIDNTSETSQRLNRIEMLIQKLVDDKK